MKNPEPDKVIELKINGNPVNVSPGSTVLDAIRLAGTDVPTLCHLEGSAPFTSCMMCTVLDKTSGKTFASCSIPATGGMEIETDNDNLSEQRKTILELLMSEHLGDCEAPCEVVCPASMPIPELIRDIRDGNLTEALARQRREIPLAGVLERVCTAPCEKGCRRSQVDQGVAIQNICRHISDIKDPEAEAAAVAAVKEAQEAAGDSGKTVGIVGAGPAGLATAFFLTKAGVRCTIIDDHEDAGGMLRGGAIPANKIDEPTLERELEYVMNDRITLQLGKRIGRDIEFDEWRKDFDAVVLTIGQITDPGKESPNMKNREPHPSPAPVEEVEKTFGVKMQAGNIKVDRKTGMTSVKGVFAGGDAARFHRMAVRAVGDARTMAGAVFQFLTQADYPRKDPAFNCSMGKLMEDELERMMDRASPAKRHEFTENPLEELPRDTIVDEAYRCMACDCAARHDCSLREYCDDYEVKANRFKPTQRPVFVEDITHPEVVHEVGKCIRCAICIRLTEYNEEPVGLAAMGRGAEKHPSPPHGKTWADALTKNPRQYADNCPVGAISVYRKTLKRGPDT